LQAVLDGVLGTAASASANDAAESFTTWCAFDLVGLEGQHLPGCLLLAGFAEVESNSCGVTVTGGIP
jgi:hypothetical protein